jgi:hypothetical protein
MIQYNAPTEQIVSALIGKTVRYFANKSTQTESGVRIFKIEAVDTIATGAKSGKRYVTVLAKDIDDCGESKYRTLQLSGIDLIV